MPVDAFHSRMRIYYLFNAFRFALGRAAGTNRAKEGERERGTGRGRDDRAFRYIRSESICSGKKFAVHAWLTIVIEFFVRP